MILLGSLLGLSVFLIGIRIMSKAFEGVVTSRLKAKINKLTSRKTSGVLIGATMTGLIQSSSATTIIIISLVHSNLLNIYNAAPIIMGANIGTTLTAQLIAFKFENLPLYLFAAGLILFPIFRKSHYKVLPKLLFSLSLIYGGMDIISFSISPIKSSKEFFNLVTYLSGNNILAILAGIFTTAILQSSSTGIAILQIMASSEIISVKTAIPIMLGQNIGTCVDTLIGSISTNRIGKQAAFIHILFNIIGVFVFYFLIDGLYDLVLVLSPLNPSRQIANAHTLFNTLTTFLLLPFSSILVNMSKKIVKE